MNLTSHLRRSDGLVVAIVALATTFVAGCGDGGPQMAPVRGTVTYRGKPLEFGSVQFQPTGGQFARADIQPDGSFELNTPGLGEGAVVGPNKVRVTCNESQRPGDEAKFNPAEGESMLGRSLIPRKYNSFNTSELIVEVKPEGNEDVVIELTDP